MGSIDEYRKKRRFTNTPEPRGEKNKQKKGKPLRFVVQKHLASSLHYDLRLEVNGVLKSWAIPKGPSQNPINKHLAVRVEDHPIEYKDFEGMIPKGNYGAGAVMIWDEGYYRPLGKWAKDNDVIEAFENGIKAGHLVFALAGKKLNGEFALIKLGHGSKNDWLLVKARDWYASDEDILLNDKSTRSGLTIEEIKQKVPKFPRLDLKIKKTPMPHDIKPMMTTLIDKPFDNKDWLFEIKWDGYRAITEVESGKPKIYSRNGKSFDEKFPDIFSSFVGYPKNAVFDGEIVAIDGKGRSSFQLLQDSLKKREKNLIYYVFDLIYFDGYNLSALPLTKRREILREILPKLPNIQFSDDVPNKGIAFYKLAKKQGLEGIIAKLAHSTYQPGLRSSNWLKIKQHMQQEAVVCGFTKPGGSRSGFGALILGVNIDDKLSYIGDVGTGFNEQSIWSLMQKMNPLITEQTSLHDFSGPQKNITWIKPGLVCEVKFQEWTKDGRMRQPVFLGLREDKNPDEVFKEKPVSETITKEHSQENDFSNPDKIFWQELNITKGQLRDYYLAISDLILPHLKNRPESMNRFPDGVNGFNFFQKNVDEPPSWMKTFTDISGIDQHTVKYIVCNDKRTLKYILNLGCIDLNIWSSRVSSPETPDFVIFDLDPVNINFSHVLETALVFKDIFQEIGVESYPKTSGKRGLHIYLPLEKKYSFDQSRDFAHLICLEVNKRLPKTTSLERQPKYRQGKVYLDYLQNRKGATIASPYCVRPIKTANVSTPVTWQEIKKGFLPEDFNMLNIPKRIDRIGDIFSPTLGKGINLLKAIENLNNLHSSNQDT